MAHREEAPAETRSARLFAPHGLARERLATRCTIWAARRRPRGVPRCRQRRSDSVTARIGAARVLGDKGDLASAARRAGHRAAARSHQPLLASPGQPSPRARGPEAALADYERAVHLKSTTFRPDQYGPGAAGDGRSRRRRPPRPLVQVLRRRLRAITAVTRVRRPRPRRAGRGGASGSGEVASADAMRGSRSRGSRASARGGTRRPRVVAGADAGDVGFSRAGPGTRSSSEAWRGRPAPDLTHCVQTWPGCRTPHTKCQTNRCSTQVSPAGLCLARILGTIDRVSEGHRVPTPTAVAAAEGLGRHRSSRRADRRPPRWRPRRSLRRRSGNGSPPPPAA